MLEIMRNQAQSWLAKVILGGIALSFALWGVGDYFMNGNSENIAEVDDAPISTLEFQQAFERQINGYRAMMGRDLSKDMIKQLGLKSNTLQTLINRRLLVDEAQQLGLTTSEAVLVSQVRNNPSFQSAGSFDPQAYRIITRNMGFRTTIDYENEMRLNLMVDVLQKAIADGVRISDVALRNRFDRDYEQRVIAAIMIDPDDLLASITINDADARAWYDAHQDRYQSEEKVAAHIVVIDPQQMTDGIEVSDEKISAAYDQRIDTFTTPQERQARQILLRVGLSADDADWKKAEEKMKRVQARLDAGEDFAVVAKEESDDITAEDGGDLGLVTADKLPPAVDEVLFSMEKDTISDVIKSSNGLVLLKLENIIPEGIKPLADVRDDLLKSLRLELAKEEAYNLSQDLDDALGMEDSLQAAAKASDITLHEISAMGRNEALADAVLGSSQELLQLTFRGQPNDVVHITELKDGRFVAVEITQRLPPALLPFKDVAGSVYDDAKADRALVNARKLAKALLNNDGKIITQSPDDVAQQAGQPKFLSKPVRRNGSGDDSTWLTQAIIDAAFSTPKGKWKNTMVETSRGMAIVYSQDVIAASEDEFKEQKETILAEAKRAKSAARFARWMASIRDQHDIVTHQGALDRI